MWKLIKGFYKLWLHDVLRDFTVLQFKEFGIKSNHFSGENASVFNTVKQN